ncbi:unnamed protein product [Brassica oleracea]
MCKILWNRLTQDKKNKMTFYLRLESSKYMYGENLIHVHTFSKSTCTPDHKASLSYPHVHRLARSMCTPQLSLALIAYFY